MLERLPQARRRAGVPTSWTVRSCCSAFGRDARSDEHLDDLPYAPPGRLHFVIDNAGTEEGAALSYATPPPNSSTPAPLANSNTYFGSEPMPQLVTNNVYDVNLYDDACEMPFKAGSFST